MLEKAIADSQARIHDSPILVVDDNEINRIFLEKSLRARGFNQIISVASAEAALVAVESNQPDLVILDIMMPGMDGFECCREIRKKPHCRNLPILIQTVITEPELRYKAFNMGATDFVSKPVYPDELYARVVVHLEKRLLLKDLEMYKQRIDRELESARQLQLSILPQGTEIQEAFKRAKLDIAAHFEPSSEIGGDFWGMKSLFPHHMALWIVDFSGHGVASALNAFRLQAYMKDISPLASRPGEYLTHLNEKLLHLLLPGQFATMFYAVIDTKNDTLFYATAGCPHPVMLRGDTRKAEMIDATGRPLGIGLYVYPTQSMHFSTNDTLLLYSDALIEAPGPEPACLTEREVLDIMQTKAGKPSSSVMEALVEAFHSRAGHRIRDDLTLCLFRREPEA